MELETQLRVTSDRMLRTLEQLETLENEKRELQPGSNRFVKLADEIERLAADVFAQTHKQQQLGEVAKTVTERTGAELAPIEDPQPSRDLQVILSDWRDAERRLTLAEPDSAEHATAAADVGRLREEYHRAYEADEGRRSAGRI
jgi:hypothetical protein